jgi:hypothetical protein
VLIPSPSMLKLKAEVISIPVDEGDGLTFLFAAKAHVPKETSSIATKILVLILNS